MKHVLLNLAVIFSIINAGKPILLISVPSYRPLRICRILYDHELMRFYPRCPVLRYITIVIQVFVVRTTLNVQ